MIVSRATFKLFDALIYVICGFIYCLLADVIIQMHI
jgi:hypothetical protein